MGGSVDTFYYTHLDPVNKPTSWNTYPSESNPDALYKFASLNIALNRDLIVNHRSSYDLLDWIGDVGGFYSAIHIIASIFGSHYTDFVFK